MPSHKFYIICIAVIFIIFIVGCLFFGVFSSKHHTDTTSSTKFNYEKAFKEMKKLKTDFDKNVFIELVNSLRILTHSKKEHHMEIAGIYTGEVFDKETKVNKKLLKIETNIKKMNDEFFGSSNHYEKYIRKLFIAEFIRKGNTFEVYFPDNEMSQISLYIDIFDKIYVDNSSNVSEELKRALSDDKYILERNKKISSFHIMCNYFLDYILE